MHSRVIKVESDLDDDQAGGAGSLLKFSYSILDAVIHTVAHCSPTVLRLVVLLASLTLSARTSSRVHTQSSEGVRLRGSTTS